MKYFVVLILTLSVSIIDATTSLTHNQIELEIKKWNSSYYSNESERTGITGSYLCTNHIKPVEFIIRNNSTDPVRISRESLKVGCIGRDTLIGNISKVDSAGTVVVGTLTIVYGAIILMAFEIITTENIRRRAAGRAGLSALQACRNTALWTCIGVGAVMGYWYSDTNSTSKVALDALLLGDEVVINPGDAVRKIAFLDAKVYNGLFTFRVLSDDRKSYAAFFDVELVR